MVDQEKRGGSGNLFHDEELQEKRFRDIDNHFADFLCRVEGKRVETLFMTARELSRGVGRGDVCLDLVKTFPESFAMMAENLLGTSVTSPPGGFTPLILDKNRLYLYRYWLYEQKLAACIRALAAKRVDTDIELLKDGLERLFGEPAGEGIDWRKVAAARGVTSHFTIVSGGPGTGKTTTVAGILTLVLEQSGGDKIRIALAAPTGKAAARLKGSLLDARKKLRHLSDMADHLPEDVATIHRIMGYIPDSGRFRHNSEEPLPFDIVVIDEASMASLSILSELVSALKPEARLILIGDRDQLASVEAGGVLGDICGTGNRRSFSPQFRDFLTSIGAGNFSGGERDLDDGASPPLNDAIIILKKNYRFGENSGIAALSSCINSGNGESALGVLLSDKYGDVSFPGLPAAGDLRRLVEDRVIPRYAAYLNESDPAAALRLFDEFRVLCAIRHGNYGVLRINRIIEDALADSGLINPYKERWYRGRPVMVTANDYSTGLFNGDTGIAFDDPENPGETALFFPLSDDRVRKVSPLRLPKHETVYAMTVHKSQGSEFSRILLILPDEESPVLTRELLYTGVTRAVKEAEICCSPDIFMTALSRSVERSSGLKELLWQS